MLESLQVSFCPEANKQEQIYMQNYYSKSFFLFLPVRQMSYLTLTDDDIK